MCVQWGLHNLLRGEGERKQISAKCIIKWMFQTKKKKKEWLHVCKMYENYWLKPIWAMQSEYIFYFFFRGVLKWYFIQFFFVLLCPFTAFGQPEITKKKVFVKTRKKILFVCENIFMHSIYILINSHKRVPKPT